MVKREKTGEKKAATGKEKLIRIRRTRRRRIEEKRARLYSIGNEKGLTIHGTSFSSPHAISIELPYD